MKRGRGHRAGVTRDMVLDAAMALADRDGLAALTMRRLAAELGVEAMTLYHHVPGKDALLDGLVERLLVGASEPLRGDATWQDALRDAARSWRAALRAHPNLVPLVLTRPAVTVRNHEMLESALGLLRRAGFPPARGLDIVYAVAGFVVGQAATEMSGPGAPTQTEVLAGTDLRSFPLLAEAASTGRGDRTDRFEDALDAMLLGFQTRAAGPAVTA